MKTRCLIVDDNQSFLDAARVLLEREGIAVVGTATTSADALRLEEELRPDVVLVDVRLDEESGFDLARRLRATGIFGIAGTGIALVAFIVLGNPATGVAFSPAMLPGFWRAIGFWLPPGAGVRAETGAVYFKGHATLERLRCSRSTRASARPWHSSWRAAALVRAATPVK